MRRRIAVLSEDFVDYVAPLVSALACEADVLLLAPPQRAAVLDGKVSVDVDIEVVERGRIRDVRGVAVASAVSRSVQSFRADILHHQVGGDPWFSLAARAAGRSVQGRVATVHEVRPRLRDEDYWFTPLARRIAIADADALVTLSDAVASLLEERYRRPPGSVARHVHGELGSTYRRLAPTPAPMEPGSVLFFGRIRPYKGLDLLIAAGNRLARTVPRFRLIIAGAGSTAEELFPAGTPPWAELHLGTVPDAAVPQLFDRAEVVGLPYRVASQSGVVALALGLGRPVVATDVGGLPEIVTHGRSGLLVPPGDVDRLADALEAVLTDAPLSAMLRDGARQAACDELRWERACRQAVDLYEAVLRSPSSALRGGRPAVRVPELASTVATPPRRADARRAR